MSQPPASFICPITHELMSDPYASGAPSGKGVEYTVGLHARCASGVSSCCGLAV